MSLTRRDVIKAGVFAGAALSIPLSRVVSGQSQLDSRMPASKLPRPFTNKFVTPPVAVPVRTDATTDYYQMTMEATPLEVIPGFKTMFFAYRDVHLPAGSVPGPTIQVNRGRQAVVRHINSLPKVHPTLGYEPWTSVHLHGSASLPQFDGYASDITNVGQFKDYEYPNAQEARTIWYHDHGVHITAPNAYMGLAGLYLIEDDLERSLPIPHGRYDVPLAIKDALFTNTGELIFDDNDASGLFGDVILVNGKPWPAMPVERRKYRFRILNASISRSYELALSTGDPFTVIGTDGGLMPAPQVAQTIRHGMAERYEVVIDFAKYPIGTRVVLRNLQPDNNREFPNTDVIMAFDVTSDATDTTDNEVPAVLNPNNATMNLQPSQAKTTRLMDFKRQGGEWAVNGRTWEDVINSGFTLLEAHPALNDVEIWTFRNNSNGWFHPVHIHLVDFKVLDRNGQPPAPYERGPKDVVYLGEGETVRMITRFGPNLGRYMMHCHNLVHEDHDMMVQFEVGTGGPDPIHAAPARNLPAPPL